MASISTVNSVPDVTTGAAEGQKASTSRISTARRKSGKSTRSSALPSSVDDRSGETRNTWHFRTQLKRLPARLQAPGSLLYFTTRTESLYI